MSRIRLYWIAANDPGRLSFGQIFTALVVNLLYGSLFAYIAALLFGLPIWLLFRSRRVTSRTVFACTGGAIGWATVLILFRDPNMLNPFAWNWITSGAPQSVLGGLFSALAFRAIIFSN